MKTCLICKRGNLSVGGYSNRVRATKYNPTGTRQAKVNLQWTFAPDGKRVKVCTRCLKASKQLKIK
ncbi:MAG: 50S ribosomal protein L28 [bacterium]|nr:50S ribosomal protein L28 [bacterium]